jgi:hypothetical protein
MFRRSIPEFSLFEIRTKSFCSRVAQLPEMSKQSDENRGVSYFGEN